MSNPRPQKHKPQWSPEAIKGWRHLAKTGASRNVRDMAKRMLKKAGVKT